MNIDPIIEEIRQGRREHASKFNHDLKAICDDFRRRENELGYRVVSLLPKRVLKTPEVSKHLPANRQS